jgi:hypothetical protein
LIECEGSDVRGVMGVVAACDILKWTTGVGVIGPRWVDTGENTRNCQNLVRGATKTEKDLRGH